jgi:hypothetical protein
VFRREVLRRCSTDPLRGEFCVEETVCCLLRRCFTDPQCTTWCIVITNKKIMPNMNHALAKKCSAENPSASNPGLTTYPDRRHIEEKKKFLK